MVTFRKYPRAKWHDYNYGLYFVTVVTRNRCRYFGEIIDGELQPSVLGSVLMKAISQSASHYTDIDIDIHTVMPNHFHAIINVYPRDFAPQVRVSGANVGCLRAPDYLEKEEDFAVRNHHNARLSAVLGGIKAAVTRYARQANIPFGWQANYHDHIIRNQREYDYITEYIANNPRRWSDDRFCEDTRG